MLESITPLILTYNEVPNIERTLQKLQWAKRIVIIDSFSDDETLEIANSYPQIEFFQRKFTSFADQCNFGLSKISTEWVLSLDADYILTEFLIEELKQIPEDTPINGYTVPFKYCVFGQPLRGTLLPPRCVLYRPQFAKYEDDGHAHRVSISGRKGQLNYPVYHDDRKPLSRWLWAQDHYMIIEAQKLTQTPFRQLSWGDKIRQQKILAPFIIFVYCLIIKGGIFDGWRGWYYALQRMFAETLLSIRLIELEISHKMDSTNGH
ncbi:glycosyltransferase family 2 protein [Synechocystis sp. FACHB-383]|uniref:glycosyltransferase family 2 protein n=1 Tax=Synechocystis sp. FACHB-383 TaxID=2692864 RepID=UPI001688E9FA|nr:glycosyltransferase family 2 protein [Synechocystis sp. FACHB-383]MBD2654444.1 glycosyltransferase family 2 protein [Synechocystis sp. FACHB-383]